MPVPTSPHRVLVVGDAMIDAYVQTAAAGISDEAPILVVDWIGEEQTPGGMLNVAASVRAAGVDVVTVGVIGDDEDGRFLRQEAERLGIDARWIVESDRPTIKKSRVLAGADHLARIDREDPRCLDEQQQERARATVEALLPSVDLVVASDYLKGLFSPKMAGWLVDSCRRLNKPILVDAKAESLHWFKGATLFKPNKAEAAGYVKMWNLDNSVGVDGPIVLAKAVAARIEGHVLITQSAEDAVLASPDGEAHLIPIPKEAVVQSTSGAGDVVMAVMAVLLVSGESIAVAAETACRIASRAVQRGGTCRLLRGDL